MPTASRREFLAYRSDKNLGTNPFELGLDCCVHLEAPADAMVLHENSSAFPDELYTALRGWTERASPSSFIYNRLPKGGHFAAWEQPQAFRKD